MKGMPVGATAVTLISNGPWLTYNVNSLPFETGPVRTAA